MVIVSIAGVVVAMLIGGAVGSAIGTNKQMGSGSGFVTGAFLGCVGWLIIALSPAKPTQAAAGGAGWHPDPLGRFDHRFYDGAQWTQHVGRVGANGVRQQFEDPVY